MANPALKLIALLLLIPIQLFSQTANDFKSIFPQNLSIKYGVGIYSIRDEYISDNKYSGILPEFNIGWSHYNCNHGIELNFKYGHSSEIKNNNAKTTIQEYSISGKHIYPITKTAIFTKPLFVYLGPSWDSFIHIRNQNMASSLFTKTTSLASFISGGINMKAIMPLTPKVHMGTSLETNIFSLVARLPDLDLTEAKFVKLMVFPLAIHSNLNLNFRYLVSDELSVGAGYRFRLTRLHSSSETEKTDGWYGIIAANNYAFINILWDLPK